MWVMVAVVVALSMVRGVGGVLFFACRSGSWHSFALSFADGEVFGVELVLVVGNPDAYGHLGLAFTQSRSI